MNTNKHLKIKRVLVLNALSNNRGYLSNPKVIGHSKKIILKDLKASLERFLEYRLETLKLKRYYFRLINPLIIKKIG